MRVNTFHLGSDDDDNDNDNSSTTTTTTSNTALDGINVCQSTFDEEMGMVKNRRSTNQSRHVLQRQQQQHAWSNSNSSKVDEEDGELYGDANQDEVEDGAYRYDDDDDITDNNNNNNDNSSSHNNYYDDDNEPPLIDHDSLHWRTILPRDRLRIQSLHEQWFPVVYQEEFYDQLVHQRMPNTGEPLFTCVATEVVDEHSRHRRPKRRQDRGTTSTTTTTRTGRNNKNTNFGDTDSENSNGYRNNTDDNDHNNNDCDNNDDDSVVEDTVVACIVGAIIDANKLNAASRQLLISNVDRYHRLFYIMTLGTAQEYRQAGLGTALVDKCQAQVAADPHCGVLYLHVITINHSAIRFYERLGFWKVQEIPDYYTIDGKNYNCYLYAKYFHGKRDRESVCVVRWMFVWLL
jgi:ribosomal protein S18 acetylase RimI-like enzyme